MTMLDLAKALRNGLRLSRVSITCLSLLITCLTAQAQIIAESPEVVYTGTDARQLRDKATQLGTVAAIYEYVHNAIEFSPYHGSRSGSVNTYLGQQGSDVDIASTMIAMLRSQNIPARYAVGTVRIPAPQLTNWLGIPHLDTALEVLKSYGIQGVALSTDRSTVDFQHAWAEAFVPFDQYRGINIVSPAIDCSQSINAGLCTWVALDASFKQKAYNGLNLDPYNSVTFDYSAYYAAIKNNDAARRNKNPLTILEDQIGIWLRTNHAGKTLEDVEDAGKIIELHEGLLPASLPFQVVGPIRRYDTVALHDAAVPEIESKKWGKKLYLTISMKVPLSTGGAVTALLENDEFLLVNLNTKRLTVTAEFSGVSGATPKMTTRLGGDLVATPINGEIVSAGYVPSVGDRFRIHLEMDGAPGVMADQSDRVISASYDAVVGGYYLIATGGESSSWSQVHRAADQLLADNDKYKIVFNGGEVGCQVADGTNCTPYVDANENGWDASDVKLLENKPALDALTGGLLYVGATQYYAKLRQQLERADRLMKVKTPVIGFLGMVSSVYEPEYIDGTAFSILPGSLLIDMKGITIGGAYRINETALNFSNRQFEFFGHIVSSMEHEIWQEITGYDAVSTVRGFQMALGKGANLLNVKRDVSTNTVPAFLSAVGFSDAAPAEFTPLYRDVYETRPYSWSHPTVTGDVGFDVIKKTPTSSEDLHTLVLSYVNDLWDEDIKCFDTLENRFKAYMQAYPPPRGGECVPVRRGDCQPPPRFTNTNFCYDYGIGGYPVPTTTQMGNVYQANALNQQGFSNFRTYWADFFKYLDGMQGFVSADFVYRGHVGASNSYSTFSVADIRNDLLLRDVAQSWVEYTLPSTLVVGCQYRFEVAIRKEFITATGQLSSMSFDIANRGAGHSDVSGCQ